jgi:hypothetical protein
MHSAPYVSLSRNPQDFQGTEHRIFVSVISIMLIFCFLHIQPVKLWMRAQKRLWAFVIIVHYFYSDVNQKRNVVVVIIIVSKG